MSNAEPRNRFTRRGFIIAAVGVGVIVIAAIIVLVAMLTRSPEPDPSPTPPASVTPSATPSADPADASVCGLRGYEEESSLTGAPDTEWELVGTVAAPTDPDSAGPGVIDDDGFRSCYAHTAEGALFAAINFVALGTDGTLRERLQELVAPGPGRDAIASQPSGESSSSRAQVAGFKIAAYNGQDATVDLALNYSTGTLVSLPMRLMWVDGDWKLILTDSGQLPLAPAEISNLGGYIPWSGA